GRTAAPPHERLGPVQGSLQMMADHGEPPQGSPKEAPPPQAADEIADGVPDDGSANRRPDGRRQGDPMLEGQHSAQDDRDLSGKDESNESRCFQSGHREDEGQSRPPVQRQDPIGDACDQPCEGRDRSSSGSRDRSANSRSSLCSVAGSPRQCSATTPSPAVLSTLRKIRAATTASSKGPRTGMNSGIRSMGEAIHAAPKSKSPFELLGTRGSRINPLNREARLGRKAAISRAAARL